MVRGPASVLRASDWWASGLVDEFLWKSSRTSSNIGLCEGATFDRWASQKARPDGRSKCIEDLVHSFKRFERLNVSRIPIRWAS